MKMKDSELLAILDAAQKDAMIFNGEFTHDNEKYLNEYLGNPYGDEDPEQSSVVSTDVADVVESDMPSLARIFLGSGDIISFQANTENPTEIEEAEDKTKYVNWIVRNQTDSFTTIHNWLKDAEIQKNGVVKYFMDESKEVEVVKYDDVDQQELSAIIDSLKGSDVDQVKVDVEDQEERESGTFDLSFRVTKEHKRVVILNVPAESFLITRNATSLEDADLVGDRIRKTRGELLADGFKRDMIDQLPQIGDDVIRSATTDRVRNHDQGGRKTSATDIRNWASEHVEIYDLYVKVDYDGDGIAERRHVMKSGNKLMINESFNHVPYASLSAILMPHKAIGRSRAEITSSVQKQKTILLRGMLNNTYMVNNPRNVVHPDIDLDDMLNVRINGIVRMDDDTTVLPSNAVFPLTTPYIGDRTLQVIQYIDQQRAQTTGAMLANQGLDSDAIGRETATRFEGVETAGQAKIELIARNYAETGFRKLYEGIAWLVSRFQDTETEFRVLGKAMAVNPKTWKYHHSVTSSVGLGAGNNEKLIEALQGIYAIQGQLIAQGSVLADNKDQYNTLKRIVDGLGLPTVNEFFNDPEQPDELLQAQNQQMQAMIQQLQQQVQQMQNPLAEAETIKQKGLMVKIQADAAIKIEQLKEEQRQFNEKQAADIDKSNKDIAVRITDLEVKAGKDLSAQTEDNVIQ